MSIKHELRKLLWKTGYDVSRFNPASHPLALRRMIIDSYSINVILDVGASTGQFAKQMRKDVGFTGKINSFEPLSTVYKLLEKNAIGDPQWMTINCAIGSTEEKKEINIAGNSCSSSFLNMLPSHIKYAPSSKYIGTELIEVKPLDSIIDGLCSVDDNIYLKIDTQGFGDQVIKGAEASLNRIDTIQLEMSLIPLYEGEMLFNELCVCLYEKGYRLVSIEPGFCDSKSGQLLQIDGIFHRF